VSDTNFTDGVTKICAEWLNAVNDFVYGLIDADKIKGVDVDPTDISDGYGLFYNEATGNLEYGGGGGTVDVVSNVATQIILGRTTAGSGDSEELTPAQARAVLQTDEIAHTGIISGGKASVNGGDNTTVDITAAVYYIQGTRYTYAGVTAQDPAFNDPSDDTVFVELDSGGLNLRNGADPAEFTATSMRTSLPIARLTASGGGGAGAVVSRIRDDRWMMAERGWRQRSFQLEAIGNIYARGGALAASGTAFQLNQETGVLYDVDQHRHVLDAISNIGGLKVITSGPTVTAPDPIVIPKTYDDGAGGETALSTNSWASHTIIKSPKSDDDDGSEGSFVLVISSTNYASESLAQQAPVEYGIFSVDRFVSVGRILVRGGSTDTETIMDERPHVGHSSHGVLSANTIQDVYNNSTTPEFVLDSTRGAVSIEDNATPIGANLFEISINGGATDYFSVDANGTKTVGVMTLTGSIVSLANGDIPITPHGTGDLILDGVKWPQADGTANQVLITNGSAQASWSTLIEHISIACSDETAALTTGAAKTTFRMPYGFTLSDVRASATTAPTGANLVVDINEGGVSILSTKLSIDVSEKTSTTAATPAVISDSALADDAEITIDIDQIGSTVAGAGLKVYLIGTQA